MCGITGIFSPQTGRDKNVFQNIGQAMNDALHQRGPDSHGIWQDPNNPILLAHRRLAIIDLSAEGHQPMASTSNRYMLVYNGEIYNFLDLKKQLEILGTTFRGRSDTEIFLAAIEQWGLNEALQKINGMFAIALWDRKQKELHLIRDRMGKKPLYLGWSGKDLVFASELKSIKYHQDLQPKINQNCLNAYLRFGYMPAPLCIYENMWMLPPAHRITLTQKDIEAQNDLYTKMQPYWNNLTKLSDAKEKPNIADEGEIIEEFENLLEKCVQDRMMSDVPLGAFLSGGIDSSSIVALMQKNSTQKIKTYSIGLNEPGFNEAEYAAKVANHLGTEHHELYLNAKDTCDIIPQLPNMYDEPFADISAIPTYLVSKIARQNVTVALSGDGGDEMLGGYNRHIAAPQIWKRMKFMPTIIRKTMTDMIQLMPTNRLDALMRSHPQFGTRLHKAASIFGLSSTEEIYMRLISQWDNPNDLVLNSREPDIPLTQNQKFPHQMSFAEQMMFKDTLSYLPNSVLTKVDRASMAISLEIRAPLLDTRIYDYVWSLPFNMKIRRQSGKYLLREILARYIPRELYQRPKQGFAIPIGKWLKTDLKDWAEDLLNEKRIKEDGYLNADLVNKTWQEHKQGQGQHAGKLWNILMFQAWHDKWM